MAHMLSFIVPVYNSERTLTRTLQSLYTQNLTVPFEIIIINDASTDESAKRIDDFVLKHDSIYVYHHKKNKGGGAARNTGISHARGDLILCVDSDNYLADSTVQVMIDTLDKKKADGVVFQFRRYFYRDTVAIQRTHSNPIKKTSFTLNDLFNDSGILLDNFLFTKKSYITVGGYPEHHGFDTQGFEVRYLSHGCSVFTAPDTMVFHRQGGMTPSYFERVYEQGEFSKNMFFIYEEIMHLFSPTVRKAILSYDVFSHSDLEHGNLNTHLYQLYKKNPKSFFSQSKNRTIESFFSSVQKSTQSIDLAWLGWYWYKKQKYDRSLDCYTRVVKLGLSTPVIIFCLVRTITAYTISKPNEIEARTTQLIESMSTQKQISIFRHHIAFIVLRKIIRSITRKQIA